MSFCRNGGFLVALALILLVSAGTAQSALQTWEISTKEQWDAGTHTNTRALSDDGGTLVLVPGQTDGDYAITKDFGDNAYLQKLKLSTYITPDRASATLDVWVSEINDFSIGVHRQFPLVNGNNEIAVSDLPSKRFFKMKITLHGDSDDYTPKIYYAKTDYIADTQAPTSAVEPAGTAEWLKENQTFNVSCTDQEGGAGCNQTYYMVGSSPVCGARLVGHWSFDGITGDVVQEPFNDVDGVLGGPGGKPDIRSNGKSGDALYFRGGSGFVMIEDKPTKGNLNNPLLNREYEFSLETWINPVKYVDDSDDPLNPKEPYIMSKWWDSSHTGDYVIKLNKTGHVVFMSANNVSGFSSDSVTSNVSVPQNAWSFIAATFYRGEMRLYVNGELAAGKDASIVQTQPQSYPNDDVYVGAHYTDNNNFVGLIDEVRIYDGRMSPEEVKAHYKLKEFWQVGALKACGALETCEYYAEGVAGCPQGEVCELGVCAYSKDGNGNVEAVGSPRQTYRINKENPRCSVWAAGKVGASFPVKLSASAGGGLAFAGLEWGTDNSTWSNVTAEKCALKNGTYPGDCWLTCSGLPNGTAYLRCRANGSYSSYASDGLMVTVDADGPSCAVTAEGGGAEVKANWSCSDPGSGVASAEVEVNASGSFVAAATQGCEAGGMDCSGTTCRGNVTCNSSMAGKDFRVRGTDGIGNAGSWSASSGCLDADGDGYCEGSGSGMDCRDDNADVHPGAAEACNGLDDDCDGEADEDWKGAPWNLTVGCGVGSCVGEMICNSTGDGTACSVPTVAGQEVCGNKLDDDCDGRVDEDYENVSGQLVSACVCENGRNDTCGSNIGVCRAGSRTCANHAWGECIGEVKPLENEICGNKLDDDCDGSVDEGDCACMDGDTETCGISTGACKQGYKVCTGGEWSECIGAVMPESEKCDRVDNDCDGQVDEGDVCEKANTCGNGVKDGDEEGVDCGGVCQKCPEKGEIELWVIVAIVAVIVIAMTGLVAALSKG
jgi:hypothetical protein